MMRLASALSDLVRQMVLACQTSKQDRFRIGRPCAAFFRLIGKKADVRSTAELRILNGFRTRQGLGAAT
jgi:hypothetical protein